MDIVIHDKTIMVAEARNLPVTSTTPSDPEVAKFVQEYVNRMGKKTNAVIGEAAQPGAPSPATR